MDRIELASDTHTPHIIIDDTVRSTYDTFTDLKRVDAQNVISETDASDICRIKPCVPFQREKIGQESNSTK